jgi:hypothetical protein
MWVAILVILVIAIAIYYKKHLNDPTAKPAAVKNLTARTYSVTLTTFQSSISWDPTSEAAAYVLTFTPPADYAAPISVKVAGDATEYKSPITDGIWPKTVVSIYAVNSLGRGPMTSAPPIDLVVP